MSPAPRVVSVNVGPVRTYQWRGHEVRSAIAKRPVTGPVRLEPLGVDGDAQAARDVHGGADKAVYAYSTTDAAWWPRHWAGRWARDRSART